MTAREDESEQLAVRDMWEDEARDFTPWLAENLHLLGAELELKLEWVQSEVPVGPYFLDILAKETDKGVKVAIENQLEETNLHHLGQLVTYATGCNAPIAVWVAPEFGYEHAQALHRLNEWTNERVRFFGVKVEVVKKAGSACPEPRLQKVVYPGGWNKEATLASGEMSLTKRRHYEFFQPIVSRLLADGFADGASENVWYADRIFPSRVHKRIGYEASLYKDRACVSLHIRLEDNLRTKQVFDELKDDREQVQKSVVAGPGTDWRWNRHDRYFFSSINIRREGSIDDLPAKLEEIRAWMIDLLPKLKDAFDPRLKKILASM